MIKYITFTFFLFAITIVSAQELSATLKLPATADPNSEFIIEITINRGQVNGFMKFFQPLPEGFTASEIDSKGGSFTFAENGAKIVWISPPGELTYTVSYKVKVPASANGIQTFGGKLSYIFNNERKAFDFETKTLAIGNATIIAKTETPKTNTSSQPAITTKTEISKTEVTKTETPKTNTSTLPAVATKTETPKTEVTKTETPKTNTSTQPIVATKTEIPKTASTNQPTETKKETSTTTKSPTVTLSSKIPVTAIPSSPGKTFRVQIGAYNLNPKITGVPQHTTVVLDNGMTKHFSGNFSSYEEAVKRKKEMIDKGYNGAFIVSFENGKIVK